MAIVAGVDFGTLSVRVSIVDSERGILASAISEYPLHRKREDPDFATQSHEDHMRALADATRKAVTAAGISGDRVESIALDTTGSSVDEGLTKDEVGEVIHRHLSEVRYCYESSILRTPDLEGKLVMGFTIGATGQAGCTRPRSVRCPVEATSGSA